MTSNYKNTRTACYIGYVIQAIVNNFLPLLFVTFNSDFGISLEKITFISAFNFTVQFSVDIISAKLSDKIGYRISIVSAQFLCAVGLIFYGILPYVLPSAFMGLLISSFFCAIGGGQIEVLVSPIMESIPSDNKSGSMSLLHSFYCWGQAAVVLFSTVFFCFFGINNWRYLSMIWAIIPILNTFMFLKVPILLTVEKSEEMSHKKLLSNGTFLILLMLMLCAGASELAMSQWASAFAETGLNVSKSVGDILGPFIFAVIMGLSRVLYSLLCGKVDLIKFMIGSGILCILSYVLTSLSSSAFISLLGCALCGFSVGILWPGTISIAADIYPKGGTFMYGLLALTGDIGCILGTSIVGFVSGIMDDNLKKGLSSAVIFPILTVVGLIICLSKSKKRVITNTDKSEL